MAVLRTIIQAPVLAVFDTWHDFALGSPIAGQIVGDHHARSLALLLQQFPQQALGRFGIAAALSQDLEHDPMLVHCAPEPVLPARDADDDLIEVPLVARCRQTPADLIGKGLAELQRTLPNNLVAGLDALGGELVPNDWSSVGTPQGNGVADLPRSSSSLRLISLMVWPVRKWHSGQPCRPLQIREASAVWKRKPEGAQPL
jgi:hypothetical protein